MAKLPLVHYMHADLVVFLNTSTRDEALKQLVDCIDKTNRLENRDLFYQAIIEREKVVSTGIGMGVAIPHAKLSSCDQFFIAIGISQKPIEWQALDGNPVRLIFMIGGPDDRQTEYLQLLSQLTQALKSDDRRKKLLNLTQASAIIELFESI